jgi:aryl-alcohol dehydrogenase-like predicted oxidoreductase
MNPTRPIGATGLQCHLLGFGCYRIMNGDPGHEAALRACLAKGGNLIDTSANYGDGSSEELVGKVLQGIPRERVIVVTKGGYIQGQNMALAQQRDFPEVVEYGPGISHCIHPEFLETQIERSCRRMQRDYIDVYLLHNPEYFLEDVSHRGNLTAAGHDEFYRRIREAFRFLEAKVAAGVIGWYGISSNNFGQPAFDSPQTDTAATCTTMTSVSRCLAEAEAVSPSHHFRVVQLPLNLYEPGGAVEPNNAGKTVLQFCQENGIGVLANRPLNAFHGNRMIRLADWAKPGARLPGPEDFIEMLRPVRQQEAWFEQIFEEPVRLASGETISEMLLRVVPGLRSLSTWEQAAGHHVIEPIQAWIVQARENLQNKPEWDTWLKDFVGSINSVLAGLRRYLGTKQQSQSDGVRAKLCAAGYPDSEESLSRLALNVLASLDGLSCALVGMRQPSYVDDAFGITEMEQVDGAAILRAFN